MQDYHKLIAWERASQLVDLVFDATRDFPCSDGKLKEQSRNAATSVVLNICEGCGKKGNADFIRYLQHAMGSACEVEGATELARNRGFMEASVSAKVLGHVIEVKKLLVGLMKSLGYTPYK
jgi:four helix bundle protein